MEEIEKPRFFSLKRFNIISIFTMILSLVAIFAFWSELEFKKQVLYIVLPTLMILLIINTISYCKETKKLHKKYIHLYKNNVALTKNFKDNQIDLKNEQNNNLILREFVNRQMNVLLTLNYLSKEEQGKEIKKIIDSYINSKGDDSNG